MLTFVIILFLKLLGGRHVDIPSLLPIRDSDEVVSAHRNYMESTVLPYYYQNGTFADFSGIDGVPISYGKFVTTDSSPSSKGAIVLLYGASETAYKYAELIYDLQQGLSGYSIYIMEHRGFGNSGRILNDSTDDRRKVYVRDFNHYVEDLKTFYNNIVVAQEDEPHHLKTFVWAHSLGGLVAAHYMQQYPNDFDGAVLSSPLFEITSNNPLRLPEWVTYMFTKISTFFGMGESYTIGNEPPNPLVDSNSQERFENALATRSFKRWTVYEEFLEKDTSLVVGGSGSSWGSTNQWVKFVSEASFQARGSDGAARITTPLLILESERDFIVGREGLDAFVRNAVNVPYFVRVRLPDAYHESYFETDDIRNEVVSQTITFFSNL